MKRETLKDYQETKVETPELKIDFQCITVEEGIGNDFSDEIAEFLKKDSDTLKDEVNQKFIEIFRKMKKRAEDMEPKELLDRIEKALEEYEDEEE